MDPVFVANFLSRRLRKQLDVSTGWQDLELDKFMEHFSYVRRNPVEWQFCCDEPNWGNFGGMCIIRIPGDEQEQNGEERAFLGQDRRFELVWLERLRRGEDKRNHNHEVVHVGV